MTPSPHRLDGGAEPPAERHGRPCESNLVIRLRAGDPDAFAETVRTYGGRMLAVARRFHADEADAEDAVQDALVSAFKALDRFEGTASLGTWLHSIVVRACLMKLRSRRRRPERAIEDLLPRYAADGHRTMSVTAWAEPTDRLAERAESRAIVRRCIEQLPDSYRTVLLLRDIEGYDTEETARLMGLNANAVKTRLHRARQALRTLLDPYFGRAISEGRLAGAVT